VLTYDDNRTKVAALAGTALGIGQSGESGMTRIFWRRAGRCAPHVVAWTAIAALAQTAAQAPVVRVFHPPDATLAYEVATIKPSDPDQQYSGTTLRRYIANAYGVSIPWGVPATEFAGSQVVGGPAWIDKDKYSIKGNAPDELRQAMQKMSEDERDTKNNTMQQSLLAERFHLKVHFETREMQLFEMIPAKGGLKVKPVAPLGDSADSSKPKHDEMSAGDMWMGVTTNGAAILQGRAVPMEMFLNALRGESPDVAGRQIVDMTGFKGKFDLKDFRFAGAPLPNAGGAGTSASDPDVPSLSQALEQQLGLKLIPAKGQVEVVVIDSIERPTEN
jgi:uncharacterized protein (TIGR03435 family)